MVDFKLTGYKTYIAAAIFFLTAVKEYFDGNLDQAFNSFSLGLGLLGIYHRVARIKK